MKAIVDSVIRFSAEDVPPFILHSLKAAAHVPNPDKESARREKIGGWQRMPDRIQLWHYDPKLVEITLPRGLAHSLNRFMEDAGHKIEWVDKRYNDQFAAYQLEPVDVRDYQDEAIEAILKAEQGYWKSPPGSGKTVAILEAIRRSGQKAIVIVNTTNIAEQWRQRARRFLGRDVEIGIIGDGEWNLQAITIAMQQTLWSKIDTFNFDEWGFVCLDECHHLPAETFTEVLSRFSAKYRIGVSGTPTKNFEWKPLLEATLGPMIHETPKKMLVEKRWLIQPRIEAIYTGFTHSFFSTHEHFGYKQGRKCLEPHCTRPDDKKRHANNYQEMIGALIDDWRRNAVVLGEICQDILKSKCILVLSRRLNHLHYLNDQTRLFIQNNGPPLARTFLLTGKESTEERMRVAEEADKGCCVIFSTLADEALDIPRIDRIHLAFPTRNSDLIRQQIGRGERPHPDKSDVLVYDYVDSAGPLQNQYRERSRNVYREEGLIVHERK